MAAAHYTVGVFSRRLALSDKYYIMHNGTSSRLIWAPAVGLLLISWLAIAGLSLQTRPDAEVIAVLFPPWWNSQQIFGAAAAASATVVRLTGVSTLLIVRPDDHDGLARLRRAGVLLAFDPQAIAACLNIKTKDI
ncbi:hypothetical protein [Tardiphaga sp.]|uniref:hypothetical protein n=1 Tax=Tardiphaga sp. TaxID=1926292 RepID=UPI00345018F5